MPQLSKPTLSQIAPALAQEFEAHLIPASAEVSCEQLFITLDSDAAGRPRRLELVFLPDEDEFYCLQFFVLLPFVAHAAHLDAMARLILRFNSKLPLVGFGLLERTDDEGDDEGREQIRVFFRCVAPYPHRALEAEMVLQTAWLITHILNEFGPLLERVGSGEWTLEQATQNAQGRFTS